MKTSPFVRNEVRGFGRQVGTLFGMLGWFFFAALLLSKSSKVLFNDGQLGEAQRVVLHPSSYKNLIFYNKPPKTGSTTVRIAMSLAAEKDRRIAARCFQRTEWNELALRSLVNLKKVDFYGCHTRLFRERFTDIVAMRGGNVTFMTNTRESKDIILSAYLQTHRNRNVPGITDPEEMREEIAAYKAFVNGYPVNALYRFHGGLEAFTQCPHRYRHEYEMRRLAERYEIIVDLERPEESAAIVYAVTGLKPNFKLKYNERTTDLSPPMLAALAKIDTSHKECGNHLVHKVLMQKYNVIKDLLLEKNCFNEDDGTYDLCDRLRLKIA